jgi:hypothetical protein
MLGRGWAGWWVTVVGKHGHQLDSVPIVGVADAVIRPSAAI